MKLLSFLLVILSVVLAQKGLQNVEDEDTSNILMSLINEQDESTESETPSLDNILSPWMTGEVIIVETVEEDRSTEEVKEQTQGIVFEGSIMVGKPILEYYGPLKSHSNLTIKCSLLGPHSLPLEWIDESGKKMADVTQYVDEHYSSATISFPSISINKDNKNFTCRTEGKEYSNTIRLHIVELTIRGQGQRQISQKLAVKPGEQVFLTCNAQDRKHGKVKWSSSNPNAIKTEENPGTISLIMRQNMIGTTLTCKLQDSLVQQTVELVTASSTTVEMPTLLLSLLLLVLAIFLYK